LMSGGMSNRFIFAYAGAHLLTSASTLMLPKLAERKPRRLFDGLGEIRKRKPFLLLLLVAYLIASGVAMVNTFLGIHIRGLGGGTDIVGIAFAVAAVSELPIIGFGSWILKRLGPQRMIVIALVAYIVRFVLLASAPSAEWVIVAQLFHGVSFGTFLVASINLAHRAVGQENAATAQALLGAMSFGFGSITGAMVGGVLLDAVGTTRMYTGIVGLMVVALVVYVVGTARLGKDSYEPGGEQPASG
jgi:MFS transporter, PPP family, 3-phenylpropionic acid transporter